MTHGTLALTHVAAETQQVVFWLLAVISVSAALGMILARKAVYCAVLLAVVMLCLAVLYAIQGAPFLAFVQVIVYTGAVLMLFLFVLMIVGIRAKDSIVETLKGQRVAAGLAGIGLLVLLSLTIGHAVIGPAPAETAAFGAANVNSIARLIFTTYVFPFEVTSALLITAALGAMVLAHRERTEPKLTQRDLSRLRTASGRPGAAARPGHLRPAQRGGHAGPAAGRQPGRELGQPVHRRTGSRRLAPKSVAGRWLPSSARCSAAGVRKGSRNEPRRLRGAGRRPVHDRRRRRAGAAQRHGHLHVRRADAERGQPGLRGVRPDAQQPRTARSSRSSSWWWRRPRSWSAWPS